MNKKLSVQILAGLLAGASASASMIEDFEGAWSGNGSVVANPDGTGNVLFLGGNQLVRIVLPGPGAGTLTFDVYDPGLTSQAGDVQGPRWGVGGTDLLNNAVFAGLRNGSGGDLDAGYYTSGTTPGSNSGGNGPSSPFNWFSPQWYQGPRQVTTLSEDPGLAEGGWSTWTFEIGSDNSVTIQGDWTGNTYEASGLTGGGQEFFAFGGSTSTVGGGNRGDVNGIYVDNISWNAIPEPGTLALWMLGVLALIQTKRTYTKNG